MSDNEGVIKLVVDSYDRRHFYIIPPEGKRLTYDASRQDQFRRKLGRPSRSEVKLRHELYGIAGQDSPALWIPPRFMRKPYYEFTTALVPPSPDRKHLQVSERRRLRLLDLKVRRIVLDIFGWETCEMLLQGPDVTSHSIFHSL